MKPYVSQLIHETDVELFSQIKQAVEKMVDPDLGVDESGKAILMSCHMLVRAVAKLYPVQVCDGLYAGCYEHSWLLTKYGNLIDPYPIAMLGGPILIDGNRASPAWILYRQLPTRDISFGEFSSNSFRRSVRRVTRALRAEVNP